MKAVSTQPGHLPKVDSIGVRVCVCVCVCVWYVCSQNFGQGSIIRAPGKKDPCHRRCKSKIMQEWKRIHFFWKINYT